MNLRLFTERLLPWVAGAMVLVVASWLRLDNLFDAHLANVDEISSLNQRDIPLFSGANANSNFLLTMILVKILRGLVDLPYLRVIPALSSVAAIGILFITLRRIVPLGVAVGTVLAVALSWNLVYFARIFEVAAFDPIVACLLMAMVARWLSQRTETGWLLLAGAMLGLHFNTHVIPAGYTIVLYGTWLFFAYIAGAIQWRVLVGVVALTAAGMIPYLLTSALAPSFSSAFENSYAAMGVEGGMRWAVNLRAPAGALRTLVEYGTYYPLPESAPWQTGLVLGAIGLTAWAALRSPANPWKTYLASISFGTLGLIALSPAAVYGEGHLHVFWPHFWGLMALMVSANRNWLRPALIVCALALLGCNISWYKHLGDNQAGAVTRLLDAELEKTQHIILSDGAWLKLRVSRDWPRLSAKGVKVFFNAETGAPDPFAELTSGEEALLIQTYECPWPPKGYESSVSGYRLLDLNQLMEAHQAHGIHVFRMVKASGPVIP